MENASVAIIEGQPLNVLDFEFFPPTVLVTVFIPTASQESVEYL